jgi:hypothetical protein
MAVVITTAALTTSYIYLIPTVLSDGIDFIEITLLPLQN